MESMLRRDLTTRSSRPVRLSRGLQGVKNHGKPRANRPGGLALSVRWQTLPEEMRLAMKGGLRNIGVGILMGLIGMPLLSCEDPVASKPLTELERAELRWERQ